MITVDVIAVHGVFELQEPMSQVDSLSQLLQMITITGQLELRCGSGSPWQLAWARAAAHEIPYHVVLKGRAVLEDVGTGSIRELVSGDIVLLPHGSAHVLHDGSRHQRRQLGNRHGASVRFRGGHDSHGERLDLLCGRFFIRPPHDRLIRDYLPTTLTVRYVAGDRDGDNGSASHQLASLVDLMRMVSVGAKPGGRAILNALTSALFTLVLRAASETGQAPAGLLALAGHPRLAPAISAMFAEPARPWSLPELADLCNMSRATFMRHFHDNLGRSATELLTDIRMTLAANELKKPAVSTEAVAESIGYRSVAAFRRVFTDKMGMTPGQWRRRTDEVE
ncbi:AraC family transcriptional regulator [Burkholderia latens]|uniref:AraC family transcriptional regulator n=2 Tax=Burkholderia latens TaxID=488446 RepID=A0A6P2P674_9BURK|nr:AraC family transcriptional regulator [Burkholderia latens]